MAVLNVGSTPQPSPELIKVPFAVRNCSLQCTRGISRVLAVPCVFMYTKRVPALKASWYLRVKDSNSFIMKACWSFVMRVSFTLNWMVRLVGVVSIWDMGSRKSSFVIIPTSLSFRVAARQDTL